MNTRSRFIPSRQPSTQDLAVLRSLWPIFNQLTRPAALAADRLIPPITPTTDYTARLSRWRPFRAPDNAALRWPPRVNAFHPAPRHVTRKRWQPMTLR